MESVDGEREWWQRSATDVAVLLRERYEQLQRDTAGFTALIAHAQQRGVPSELGYPDGVRMLADTLRLDLGTARQHSAHADLLHSSVSITGQELPATLPHVAEAFADGTIHTGHVEKIRATLHDLPATVDEEDRDVIESSMVQAATVVAPAGLNRLVREILARYDPDGELPPEQELSQPARELHCSWRGDNLWVKGYLDREAGMKFQAALSPLAAPRHKHRATDGEGGEDEPAATGNDRDTTTGAGTAADTATADADTADALDTATTNSDADTASADPEPDLRSIAERRGDALAELIDLALRGRQLPHEGGEAITLVVTMGLDDLRSVIVTATLFVSSSIPV
ncbi:MAG: DUF222 domain-containing protein [Sciscionella sp.]